MAIPIMRGIDGVDVTVIAMGADIATVAAGAAEEVTAMVIAQMVAAEVTGITIMMAAAVVAAMVAIEAMADNQVLRRGRRRLHAHLRFLILHRERPRQYKMRQ